MSSYELESGIMSEKTIITQEELEDASISRRSQYLLGEMSLRYSQAAETKGEADN